ncbi:MAG TPA: PPOX class F420-dependent oxidoreductase [Pseudonocardiaceae bacterium]|nr:PPOX class F420-dependent oxidoreductase [Pseudonocardiaceae bacterium]
MTEQLDQLVAGKYLLLTTFRKDGRAVATPVWFAKDGAELKVWTVTDSGKVKRIRRDGAVTITACDVRGKPHGDAIDAQARLLDEAETLRVRSLISRRYGLFGWVVMLGSRLRRGSGHNVGIAITPAG